MVVVVEGTGHVGGSAVGVEVAGGGEDRVVVAVDVALAVPRPRRGQELHGALRAGGARASDAAHAGLDEVDRGEVRPGHAEGSFGLAVVTLQLVRRCGRDDVPRGQRGPGRCQPLEVDTGGHVRGHCRPHRLRQQGADA